ncbi:hypothetical protein SDC9_212075 [bioreactor metagenome]|uniref:Uncharacterized protein n=1 Tax=bioreactor metagenome TaxID=1076179 RepID=A0A645JXJ9_9ZZZZ
MKLVYIPAVNDSVAGVVPSLGTDDDIRLRSENINYFSFTFIAPLGSGYDAYHIIFLLIRNAE